MPKQNEGICPCSTKVVQVLSLEEDLRIEKSAAIAAKETAERDKLPGLSHLRSRKR